MNMYRYLYKYLTTKHFNTKSLTLLCIVRYMEVIQEFLSNSTNTAWKYLSASSAHKQALIKHWQDIEHDIEPAAADRLMYGTGS